MKIILKMDVEHELAPGGTFPILATVHPITKDCSDTPVRHHVTNASKKWWCQKNKRALAQAILLGMKLQHVMTGDALQKARVTW